MLMLRRWWCRGLVLPCRLWFRGRRRFTRWGVSLFCVVIRLILRGVCVMWGRTLILLFWGRGRCRCGRVIRTSWGRITRSRCRRGRVGLWLIVLVGRRGCGIVRRRPFVGLLRLGPCRLLMWLLIVRIRIYRCRRLIRCRLRVCVGLRR